VSPIIARDDDTLNYRSFINILDSLDLLSAVKSVRQFIYTSLL